MKIILILFCLWTTSVDGQNDSASKNKCRGIITSFDKFDSLTLSYTSDDLNIGFAKSSTNRDTTYSITAVVYTNDAYVGGKGFYIMFSDGSIIRWENAISSLDFDPNKNMYTLTTLVALTESQVQEFLSKRVSDYKIYHIIETITEEFSKTIFENFRCLYYQY